MKILGLILGLLMPTMAQAAATPLPDTPSLGLSRPVAGDTGYVNKLNNNAVILDNAVLDKRVGGTVVGDLTVTGSIIGNASLLTGIPTQVTFVSEDFTASCNGVTTAFAISTTPLAGSVRVVQDGLTQRLGTDYTFAGITVTMATAPAANTASFLISYSTGATGGAGAGGGLTVNAPLLGIGSVGNPLRIDPSSVTMLGPTISPAEAPLLASQLQLDQVIVSTGNLQSQINALGGGGGATVYANTPILGDGGTGNHLRLDTSSATLQGNSFNAANRLVQLNGSAQLPAVSGALLTNLPATIPATNSASATAVPINSTSFVGVATATVVGVGGRPLLVIVSVNINNGAGATRDYQMRFLKNGALIAGPLLHSVQTGLEHVVTHHYFEASSSAGSTRFTLDMLSSSATGTQTADAVRITAIEL